MGFAYFKAFLYEILCDFVKVHTNFTYKTYKFQAGLIKRQNNPLILLLLFALTFNEYDWPLVGTGALGGIEDTPYNIKLVYVAPSWLSP